MNWRGATAMVLWLPSAICCTPTLACADTRAAFAPSKQAIELVTQTIGSATKSIDIAAYCFTSGIIADALVTAHDRGVEVMVLFGDGKGRPELKVIKRLRRDGIGVRVASARGGIMHDKYMIVDEKTVETGSFNYTSSAAASNDENVLVISNDRDLAEQYLNDWNTLWNKGLPASYP